MGRGLIHLRFQRIIPIFFHAIDQNVELQEYMGLSTGRLDSDMRTSLDCTLFVDCLSISIFSTSALITALLLFSFLRTVLFCLLYAKPGLVCMTYRYWALLSAILSSLSGIILLSRRAPTLLYAQISAIPKPYSMILRPVRASLPSPAMTDKKSYNILHTCYNCMNEHQIKFLNVLLLQLSFRNQLIFWLR